MLYDLLLSFTIFNYTRSIYVLIFIMCIPNRQPTKKNWVVVVGGREVKKRVDLSSQLTLFLLALF